MVKIQRMRECKRSNSKRNINHASSFQCTGIITEKKCRKIERVEMHVGKDIIFALSEFVEHTK